MLEELFPPCYAHRMQITVQLPDDLAQRPDPGHEALAAIAIEGYRTGTLSHFEASQILGLSRIEFDAFLKDRQLYEHAYGLEDLEADRETLRQLRANGILQK